MRLAVNELPQREEGGRCPLRQLLMLGFPSDEARARSRIHGIPAHLLVDREAGKLRQRAQLLLR